MKATDFKKKKQRHEKITMLTCYDYPSARIIAESSLDCVLVGDSVAMTVHGHDSTVMATIEMMTLHTQAVARGIKNQFLISDLPFLCHRQPCEEVIQQVRQLMQAGANAIKIEGGDAKTCALVHDLVTAGVPVLGHLGLTPQSVHQLGGYRVQGKSALEAERILEQAQSLEKAGCLAIVLECIPAALAKTITDALSIPTIGIGASAATDGQVLVWHDLLGIQNDFHPRFVKQYAMTNALMLDAINAYVVEVTNQAFPAAEHAF
jgi:3-methyl-2-oxobutanoate hydroxymethyltransferase